jgi:hypothetical protein
VKHAEKPQAKDGEKQGMKRGEMLMMKVREAGWHY